MDTKGRILFEDDYLMVVNKPAGLMVEPDRNNFPNLLNHVKRYLRNSGIYSQTLYAQHLHRLDRPVSGCVLFAKQKIALRPLSEQFAARTISKQYQALTNAMPAEAFGELVHWHRKEKKKACLVDSSLLGAEQVRLSYKVEAYRENKFLWNIDLHTGKFHQIRIQLAHEGCPIIGDVQYGSDTLLLPTTIALHANRLTFLHPITGTPVAVEAPLPAYF